MRATRLLAATLLCSLGAAALTACGSSAAPAASSSGSASPSPSGLDGMSAQDIMKQAQAVNAKVTAVKMAYDLTVSGAHLTGTVAQDSSGNCTGKIAKGDQGSFDILVANGTAWIMPDKTFWSKNGASPSVVKAVSGKYLKGTAASLKSYTTMCGVGVHALNTLGKKDDGSDDTAGATKGDAKQIGSTPAVAIKDSTGAEVDIATQGDPYVLQVTSSGQGTMKFSDFNQPVTVTSPSASEVLDASKYLKG